MLTPDPDEANVRDRGAAGTMAIPIPPSVTQVTCLRIAVRNEGEIRLQLIRGGWDWSKQEHIHQVIVKKIITGAPFMETLISTIQLWIPNQTLSLWLWGTRRTSISLIATESSTRGRSNEMRLIVGTTVLIEGSRSLQAEEAAQTT